MENETPSYIDELKRKIINDEIPIRTNGHHRIADETTVFSKTWFSRSEYTLEYVIGGMNLMLLSIGDTIRRLDDKVKTSAPDLVPDDDDTSDIDVLQSWERGIKTEPVPIGTYCSCYDCGTYLTPHFDGEEITFVVMDRITSGAHEHCLYPGGIGEYAVTINVPSGRLVFANDMRRMLSSEIQQFDINTGYGILQTVQAEAERNVFTAFLGNTCPKVLVNGDEILIAHDGFDEDDNVTTNFGEEVGYICTDLWWFYAMDGDAYDAAPNKVSAEATVQGKPGTYQMTVHTRPVDDNWMAGRKYVTITRIGD